MNSLERRHDRNRFPVFFPHFLDDDFFSDTVDSDIPAINVKENKKAFTVDVSIPGFDKEDVHVEVNKDILTISAKKEVNKEEKDEDDEIIREEFTSSSFTRSFTLPDNVDTEGIGAKQKNGVLKITLPKKEKALENTIKQIEVK